MPIYQNGKKKKKIGIDAELIPGCRVPSLTKKILALQPKALIEQCLQMLRERVFVPNPKLKEKNVQNLPEKLDLNEYLILLLANYKSLKDHKQAAYYVTSPADVPLYERCRTPNLVPFIMLRDRAKPNKILSPKKSPQQKPSPRTDLLYQMMQAEESEPVQRILRTLTMEAQAYEDDDLDNQVEDENDDSDAPTKTHALLAALASIDAPDRFNNSIVVDDSILVEEEEDANNYAQDFTTGDLSVDHDADYQEQVSPKLKRDAELLNDGETLMSPPPPNHAHSPRQQNSSSRALSDQVKFELGNINFANASMPLVQSIVPYDNDDEEDEHDNQVQIIPKLNLDALAAEQTPPKQLQQQEYDDQEEDVSFDEETFEDDAQQGKQNTGMSLLSLLKRDMTSPTLSPSSAFNKEEFKKQLIEQMKKFEQVIASRGLASPTEEPEPQQSLLWSDMNAHDLSDVSSTDENELVYNDE